jgi:hypothetical protein
MHTSAIALALAVATIGDLLAAAKQRYCRQGTHVKQKVDVGLTKETQPTKSALTQHIT